MPWCAGGNIQPFVGAEICPQFTSNSGQRWKGVGGGGEVNTNYKVKWCQRKLSDQLNMQY